jgi:hypothetical protein
MEAKDLMIGNWVNFNLDNGNFIVSEIDGYDTYSKTINGLCLGDIKPIPLTEEWLLKFGFDNSLVKDIFLALDCNVIYDEGKYYFRRRGFQMVIKHVHQLQNLYKVLTGEELVHG